MSNNNHRFSVYAFNISFGIDSDMIENMDFDEVMKTFENVCNSMEAGYYGRPELTFNTILNDENLANRDECKSVLIDATEDKIEELFNLPKYMFVENGEFILTDI